MSKSKFIAIIAAAVCVVAALAMILASMLGGRTTLPAAEVTTFLSGTTVDGQDVSGLTPEEAAAALAERTQDYTCKVTLGEKTYTVTGEELSLAYNEDTDLQALLDQQKEDETLLEFTVDGLYTADMTALRTQLEADYPSAPAQEPSAEEAPAGDGDAEAPAEGETGGDEGEAAAVEFVDPNAPKNAYLTYDEGTGSFVIVPDEPGTNVDCDAVVEQVEAAVLSLEPEVVLDMEQFVQQAEITADSEELQAALEEANSYLELQLTYTFTPDGGSTSSETVSREELGKIFYVNTEDMSVQVDEEILGSYVNDLVQKYSVAGKSTQFKTTGGSYININIAQAGQSVDSNALYDDLLSCLQGKTGGTRTAPYMKASDDSSGYWGGNYVEIDQTSQHLWCYRNGVCVVSCDVVSGCVADNTRTPNGVFTIYAMNRDRYLRGNNIDGTKYESWVSYFMPFSGGCGIHDATWRSVFGGTQYYFNGSHGCVGTPLSSAKKIYENVSVGTHVVIYGGISSSQLPSTTPTINFAKSEYTVEVGQTIDLGITTDSDGSRWLATSNGNAVPVGNNGVCGVSVGDVVVGCYVDASGKYKEGHVDVIVHVVPAGSLAQAQNISVSVGTNSLTVGQTTTVSVSGNATAPKFSSSNAAVAAVDANGTVTAKGAGKATITVTCPADSGHKEASKTVEITVTAPVVEKKDQTVSAQGLTLTVGESGNVKASGKGAVTYTSSDPAVASVDGNGNVTANAAGQATITVSFAGDSEYKSASINVTINVTAPAVEPDPPVDPDPPVEPDQPGGASSSAASSQG